MGGREKERERNINVWLPLECSLLGTWPATQACALIRNWTGDPLVPRPELNPFSHTSQGNWLIFYINDSSRLKLRTKLIKGMGRQFFGGVSEITYYKPTCLSEAKIVWFLLIIAYYVFSLTKIFRNFFCILLINTELFFQVWSISSI